MLKFYINAVKYGYKTIDEVPEQYRSEVEERIDLEVES
ncbi:CD1375 family protein [Chengkuizengella marina]|nr:CD1375 family protein [Chengkuizengella marina]